MGLLLSLLSWALLGSVLLARRGYTLVTNHTLIHHEMDMPLFEQLIQRNLSPDILFRNLSTNFTTATRNDSNAMIQYRYYLPSMGEYHCCKLTERLSGVFLWGSG